MKNQRQHHVITHEKRSWMWHKQTFITLYKKSYKPVLLSTGLVAVYALFGFKLLPYLLKTQLPELITQQTKTPATLADATFNPFTFTLSLTGFELQDKQKQPLLKFDGLFVAMNALASIKTQTLVIEQLRLDKPQTHLGGCPRIRFTINSLADNRKIFSYTKSCQN